MLQELGGHGFGFAFMTLQLLLLEREVRGAEPEPSPPPFLSSPMTPWLEPAPLSPFGSLSEKQGSCLLS